jgi:hypothetical protein
MRSNLIFLRIKDMRKNAILTLAFFPVFFILSFISPEGGFCQPVDKIFEQLSVDLKSKGVSDEFIKITGDSVKRMIEAFALTSEIEVVLLDLWGEKVKGRALKNAVTAVAELVESGDNVLEAGRIASGAAHQAEAEGLSGFGVGMRVKKAVQERKAYLSSLSK